MLVGIISHIVGFGGLGRLLHQSPFATSIWRSCNLCPLSSSMMHSTSLAKHDNGPSACGCFLLCFGGLPRAGRVRRLLPRAGPVRQRYLDPRLLLFLQHACWRKSLAEPCQLHKVKSAHVQHCACEGDFCCARFPRSPLRRCLGYCYITPTLISITTTIIIFIMMMVITEVITVTITIAASTITQAP